MKSLNDSDSHLQHIHSLMREHQYEAAEEALNSLLGDALQPQTAQTIVALARCQLAQEKPDEAHRTYQHILDVLKTTDEHAKGEAALVLGHAKDALAHLEHAKQGRAEHPDLMFLLALTEYKLGFLNHASTNLRKAVELGFEWEDDDPVDFVVQDALGLRDFHDFEHLYLDVYESLHEGKSQPQNRWFALNMPILELLSASKPETRKKRALHLAHLLSPHFDEMFLTNGRSELWKILDDLSKSKANSEFGTKARTALKANDLQTVAQLVLALELDHLKQFAPFFGLSVEHIEQSDLQQLIPKLPLRLAVAIMFLYSVSDPKDKLPAFNELQLDPEIHAGLIAASFITYYQQVEQHRSTVREQE